MLSTFQIPNLIAMGHVLWVYLYLSQNIVYDATIILQFEEPRFILITFIKPRCIFVLKKLHFGVFMGESLFYGLSKSI